MTVTIVRSRMLIRGAPAPRRFARLRIVATRLATGSHARWLLLPTDRVVRYRDHAPNAAHCAVVIVLSHNQPDTRTLLRPATNRFGPRQRRLRSGENPRPGRLRLPAATESRRHEEPERGRR